MLFCIPIDIGKIKMKYWCKKFNLFNIYLKLIENNYNCLSKISLLSHKEKRNLCNKLELSSLDKNAFFKNLPRLSSKYRKRVLNTIDSIEINETKKKIAFLIAGKNWRRQNNNN